MALDVAAGEGYLRSRYQSVAILRMQVAAVGQLALTALRFTRQHRVQSG